MLRGKGRFLRRPIYLAILFPMMISISFNCIDLSLKLHSDKEMLDIADTNLHELGMQEVLMGVFVYLTMCSLVSVVLTRCSIMWQFIIICEQIIVFLAIVMVSLLLYSQKLSLNDDEVYLNCAVLYYGQHKEWTKIINTTQRWFHCCGVVGVHDWKRANATYIADSLTYVGADKAVVTVPKTCARINNTSVEFNLHGCLPSFFEYKMDIVNSLLFNAGVVILFEIAVFLLIIAIIIDLGYVAEESDEEAKAESTQAKDVPSVNILPDLTKTTGEEKVKDEPVVIIFLDLTATTEA